MANRALLVLLVQTLLVGLVCVWSMEGVLGQEQTELQPVPRAPRMSSFITRRLSGSGSRAQLLSGIGAALPGCPQNCRFNIFLPNCCPIQPNSRIGFCTNYLIDDNNCGACGIQCTFPRLCTCGGQCIDLLTDPNNCGRCGRRCGRNGSRNINCRFGVCGY